MANNQLLHVARPKECNTQQTARPDATAHATGMQQPTLKALSGAVLGRNSPCNSPATEPSKACNNSPTLKALSVARIPIAAPRRDRLELAELIAAVALFHGFTESETKEAGEIASRDLANALTCFRDLAGRVGIPMPKADDRVVCSECSNFIHRQCRAAAQGLMADTYRGYSPVPDVPRRCEHFKDKYAH